MRKQERNGSTSCLPRKLCHERSEKSIENTEKRERPQERFDRMNSKRYTLKVMTRTEADIIEKLDSVPNKAGYIKELIRRDIGSSK